LGQKSKYNTSVIASVKMLGSDVRVRWVQGPDGLIIKKPARFPSWQVIGYKIEFKDQGSK
jgi:alpha-L-fucosidase